MAYLAWNDAGLLCGHDGVRPEPIFVWTYSDFERHLTEFITPSMYHYMAGYVSDYITDTCLVSIQQGSYISEGLEAEAVDAYFAVPIKDRIEMHEQELVNLAHAKKMAEENYNSASQFVSYMQNLANKYSDEVDRLDREYSEEMQWFGGHEKGAENFF